VPPGPGWPAVDPFIGLAEGSCWRRCGGRECRCSACGRPSPGSNTISVLTTPLASRGVYTDGAELLLDEDPEQMAVPANGIEAGAIRFPAFDGTGYFPDGFFVTSATRGSRLRFIALDVGDRTMLALIDAPPNEFVAFADQAAAVLASMRPTRGA
jgi:hypothetical protein